MDNRKLDVLLCHLISKPKYENANADANAHTSKRKRNNQYPDHIVDFKTLPI